jgi:DNA-binding NarL/FixJ family response regulator
MHLEPSRNAVEDVSHFSLEVNTLLKTNAYESGTAPALFRMPELVKERAMNGQIEIARDANRLTARESDVLRLLARGCTYGKAADVLGVSPHTITTHIKNAYRKLGVHSGAAAVMRAMELRLFGEF